MLGFFKLKGVFILFLFLLGFSSLTVEASFFSFLIRDKTKKLAAKISQDLSLIETGIKTENGNHPLALHAKSSFATSLQLIRLGIGPNVFFSLPPFLQIRIIPWVQVELVRGPPVGYKKY